MNRFAQLIGILPVHQQAERNVDQPWFAALAVFACASLALAGAL